MATKDQYEYFKNKYKEEDERNITLTKRAEIYLSLISILFTGLIFKLSDIKVLCNENSCSLIAFIILLFLLLVTLGFTLDSIRIKDYESDLVVEDYVNELGDKAPTDEEFFDNRIATFIAATKENFTINNTKGDRLKYAGGALFISVIVLITFIIITITS